MNGLGNQPRFLTTMSHHHYIYRKPELKVVTTQQEVTTGEKRKLENTWLKTVMVHGELLYLEFWFSVQQVCLRLWGGENENRMSLWAAEASIIKVLLIAMTENHSLILSAQGSSQFALQTPKESFNISLSRGVFEQSLCDILLPREPDLSSAQVRVDPPAGPLQQLCGRQLELTCHTNTYIH